MSPFGCVLVEHFDAAAAERCEPALRERPLAIVDTRVERPMVGRERPATANRNGAPTANRPSVATATTMMIVEANAEARAQGVRPGMTETEARARCPTLVVRPSIEEQVLSARHALLEAALAVGSMELE